MNAVGKMNHRDNLLPGGLLMLALFAHQAMCQLPEDAQWDDRFAVAGVQGNVSAMAFDKKRIYAGGAIQSVGRTTGGAVVEFDDKNWRPLSDGPELSVVLPNVFALKVFNNRLYVGGNFTNAGGMQAGGLASWHENKWSVEAGASGSVYALGVDGGDLVVGGRFAVDGFTNPVALSRFNGRDWQVLNSELPPCGEEDLICLDSIQQVEVLPGGDAVCIIAFSIREEWGGFSFPSYRLLLKCDRQAVWSAFPGPDGNIAGLGVSELTRFGDALIAAGSFSNTANANLRNIAQWNGTEWLPLGQGFASQVHAIAGNDRVLYAFHDRDTGDPLRRAVVSKWDGKQWRVLGAIQAIQPFGRLFVGPNDDVYVSGLFVGVDDVVAPGLIHWDGHRWRPVVKGSLEGIAGLTSITLTFVEHRGSIYMGGAFSSAGSDFAAGLARWDGKRWHDAGGSFGTWPPRRVQSLASSGERLYVGGAFTQIGNASATNIASWDGSSWTPLGSGITNTVTALTWWNSNLYAGGRFETAGDVAANNVAAWDGNSWRALAGGCNSNVSALATWRGQLYAGGRFTLAGDVPVSRLARWDGQQWHDVGQGVDGESGFLGPNVRTIAAGQDGLYVGGQFTIAGSIVATNIARWDGVNWHSMNQSWRGSVNAIATSRGNVFAGGQFIDSDDQLIDGILRWDGTNWSKLGSGIGDDREFQVIGLLARDDELFVGGRFTRAGDKPSASVARWSMGPPRKH